MLLMFKIYPHTTFTMELHTTKLLNLNIAKIMKTFMCFFFIHLQFVSIVKFEVRMQTGLFSILRMQYK